MGPGHDFVLVHVVVVQYNSVFRGQVYNSQGVGLSCVVIGVTDYCTETIAARPFQKR